jgi:hypothetical protein
MEGAEGVETTMIKLEWEAEARSVLAAEVIGNRKTVAVRDIGTLGHGATGLTELEIAEAFRLYHEHMDPRLPESWIETVGATIMPTADYWLINENAIKDFEQVLTWLRWKLEQQSAIEKAADGG